MYRFCPVTQCSMCGQATSGHKVLGLRLNGQQGLRPYRQLGVAVTVCRCSQCGLVYANPRPTPEKLDDHYGISAEDYWPEIYFQLDPAYFQRQLDRLCLLTGARKGRALDIGAGLGKVMLALERAGWEAHGIEPGRAFHHLALTRMGIAPERLQLASLEEAHFDHESFDFISFGAVLEHLADPGQALRKAAPWLRPGGLLHLEVPSSEWLIARLLNLYYRFRGTAYVTHLSPMHPPYHLYEFTPASFHAAVSGSGLEVAFIEREVGDVYHLPRWLHGLVQQVMAATQTGMQLCVWLRRAG